MEDIVLKIRLVYKHKIGKKNAKFQIIHTYQ